MRDQGATVYECLDKFVQPVEIDDFKTDKHGVQVNARCEAPASKAAPSAVSARSGCAGRSLRCTRIWVAESAQD